MAVLRVVLCKPVPITPRRKLTRNLSKVSRFLFKSFYIRRLQKQLFFFHTNPYILNVTQQCRWSYFELGSPVLKRVPLIIRTKKLFSMSSKD